MRWPLAVAFGASSLGALALAGASPPPARAAGPAPAVEIVPLRDVRILDGPFREAQRRDVGFLLGLDPERLLHTFRLNAGLPTAAAPYGGWEAPSVELRGHSLGHYLTALSLMWEATGDERLRDRARRVVAGLREVQLALPSRGMTPGYLSAFPEELLDRVEARRPVWAPYYTLHKILAGLLDAYRVTDDPAALEAARGMASWVARRASRLTDAQWQAMLETEFGGMQEALAELYALTGDPEHLKASRLFDHRAVFDPLERGEDPLDGLHANTQIPKAIGAARDCELTGERRYCAVAETFWQRVALRRSYAIGGHSEDEHFSPVASLSRHLGESTAETCNTYNMLKLTRHLFRRDARRERLEFYERGLFNHILASQDPETGMFTYYVALKPGAWRTYSTPEDSFWCCVGTGMENPARFGELIYARRGDEAVLVNLFVASELAWREKGLVLRQETRFPDEGGTRLRLRLARPLRLALELRHPAWVAGRLEVTVNGRPQPVASQPGSSAAIEREWRDGDLVEVRLPMSLRFEALPDDPRRGALVYGPIVLAADLGAHGVDAGRRRGAPAPEMHAGDVRAFPALVADSPEAALARVRPSGRALSFRTEGLGRPQELELRPFFRLSDRRHAVYFDVLSEAAWVERETRARDAAEQEAVRLARRTVDAVTAGDPEAEAAHALEETGSDRGWHEGRRYRSARRGARFAYTLKLPASGPVALRVAYWGGETRRHVFEVMAEGEVIATQSLFDDRPGEVFPVEYRIPERLRRGQESLRVAFRTGPSGSMGAVYDVRIVRLP